MRNFIPFSIFMLSVLSLQAQKEASQAKLTLNIKYGAAYSFFVKYEQSPDEVPPGFIAFYDKNRIGSIGGGGLTYHLNRKNSVEIAYERQMHVGVKNFNGIVNGTLLTITDFKLRHTNNFFELNYQRSLSKNDNLEAVAGVYLLYPEQQEISLLDNFIEIDERNNKNAHLMEGGIAAGLKFSKKLTGNFRLGLESKIYFTASLGEFETISVMPLIAYDF